MLLPAFHLMAPAARGEDVSLLAHLAHVALDGDDARGQAEGDILVGKDATLVNRFIGDADDLVVPQTAEPELLVDRQVLFRIVQRQLDGDFLAEGDGLAGGFVLIDSQIGELAGAELHLGIMQKVVADLRKVCFCQDGSEAEISGDG